MSPWRYELARLLTIVALFAMVVWAFPFDAIGFVAKGVPCHNTSFAAFVTLSEEDYAAALRAAKTSWHGDVGGVRRMRVNLSIGSLPEEPSLNSLDLGLAPQVTPLENLDYSFGPAPDSLAAPQVKTLPKEALPAVERISFSKAEFLRLDHERIKQ